MYASRTRASTMHDGSSVKMEKNTTNQDSRYPEEYEDLTSKSKLSLLTTPEMAGVSGAELMKKSEAFADMNISPLSEFSSLQHLSGLQRDALFEIFQVTSHPSHSLTRHVASELKLSQTTVECYFKLARQRARQGNSGPRRLRLQSNRKKTAGKPGQMRWNFPSVSVSLVKDSLCTADLELHDNQEMVSHSRKKAVAVGEERFPMHSHSVTMSEHYVKERSNHQAVDCWAPRPSFRHYCSCFCCSC